MRRVRICAPNVWAMSRENMDFAHPIFEPYFMFCAPNIKLTPPPLDILLHNDLIILRFFYFPRGNIGEYDPAEIHNQGMMKKHLVGVGIHLAWQMLGFFIFLYW